MMINIRGERIQMPDNDSSNTDGKYPGITQPKKASGGKRSRAETVEAIYGVIAGSSEPLTRFQIANAVSLTKSKYFRTMLLELESAGRIQSTARINKLNVVEIVYWVEKRKRLFR